MTKKILQLVVVLLIASQGVMAQTVKIDSVTVDPGNISVQVDMLSFTDVAAVTLYIEFDSDLMAFTGISNTQLTGSWVANYNASLDKIIVTYTASPTGSGYSIDGKAFDLDFDYYGGFSTDVTFDETNCEIAGSDLSSITSTYINGFVEQTTAVGTVSMEALTETPGTTINMPLNMEGAGFGSIASLTFMITYDQFQLSYAGIVEDAITGVTASASNGILEILWSGNGSTVDFTTLSHLLDIQFEYNGGNADVAFVSGCEVNDNTLGALAVTYVNGTVAATAGTASLTIDNIGATAGTAVNIPIVAADFGSNVVGAITMVISYNSNLLEYTGYTAQQLSGWVVNSSTIGELTMEWSSLTGSTLTSDNLVTLNFNYDSVGGSATIAFEPGTFIKDVNLDIIPVSLYNGSVANLTVSGQLTYFGDALRPVGTSGSTTTTAYLKNAADSTIAYTSTTDASGNYLFEDVGAGSYFLDGTTDMDVTLAYDMTDAFVIFGIGGTFTGLQALASDVNDDGAVDMTDAFVVYGSILAGNVKVASWIAADWFFDNVAVTVNTVAVSQDFGAIASGDANADFVPIP